MTQPLQWTLNAKDQGVVNALNDITSNLQKVNREFDKVGRTGERSGRRSKQSMGALGTTLTGLARQFSGVALQVTGLVSAAALLRSEWQAMKRIQQSAQTSQVGAALAVRKAKLAFTPDATVSLAQLEGELKKVANETHTPLAVVAGSAEGAFSAAGSKTNREVLETLKQTYRLAPGDAEIGDQLSQRSLDVQKISNVSAKASLGFLLEAARGSRVTNVAQFGATGTRAIAALTNAGDTPEQAAELFGATTGLANDAEGRRSATALISLANQMKKFVPERVGQDKRGKFFVPTDQIAAFEAAQGTTAQLGVMQRSPELRRQFLGGASFEAGTSDAMTQLLSGSAKARAELKAAQAKINAPNEAQAALYDKFVAELDQGMLEQAAQFDRRKQSAVETFRNTSGAAARSARANEALDAVLDNVNVAWGPDGPYKAIIRSGFAAKTGAGADPTEEAIDILGKIRDDPLVRRSTEEQNLIQKQIDILESIDRGVGRRQPKAKALGRNQQ